MKLSSSAAAVAAVLCMPLAAQTSATSSADEQVVVTASRFDQASDSVIAPLTIIDREQIERSSANDLLDVLAMQPGIEINRNGGRGQTSSIFIRGTGSNQSIILLNGTRLNDATTGTAQLSLLSLDLVERVEIIRGARASIYGSDAIGGVVNIITKPAKGSDAVHLLAGVGSNDRYFGGVRAAGQFDATQLYLAANRDQSKGYDFLPEDGVDQRYGYETSNLNLGLNHEFNQQWQADLSYLYSQGETDYESAGKATSKPRKQLFDAALKYQQDIWFSHLLLNSMYDRDERYSAAGTFSSRSATKRKQVHWLNGVQLSQQWLLQGGLEWKQDDVSASSTAYQETKRDNKAAHVGAIYSYDRYNAELGLRYDDNSAYGSSTNYNLGGSVKLSENWKLLAIHSTAFRAPTFNELYYPGGGNPQLKPENAKNYELGVEARFDLFALDLNVYRNDIEDMISGWPAQNINQARITGVEAVLGFDTGLVRHQLVGELMDPKDRETGNQLVRRAKEKLKWRGDLDVADWRFTAEYSWRGKSYNDVANTLEIPSHQLFNLAARYFIVPAWSVDAKVHNLTDESYATVMNTWPITQPYQAPGRTFELSTRYQF